MSVLPHEEPLCTKRAEPTIDLEIDARLRGLVEGFSVRRLLPSAARRMVGPFIFFDHMGPAHLAPEHGLDVRPHPHINLATVTYLFEGEVLHRDSIGSEQVIRPGAVNWMTAGRGIAHSERTPTEARKTGPALHGLQLWVGLPKAHEEMEPSFQHHRAKDIPILELPGAHLRLIAGSAYGAASPVKVQSKLFYVEARLERGATLDLPDDHARRAAYVVEGTISCDGKMHGPGSMLVFRERVPSCLTASEPAWVMLLGGDPLDGERHVWWNFVSSSIDRIEQAKRDWKEGRFARVKGDDQEFIPLPVEMGRPR